jgi:hypothetical protein
MFMIQPIVPDTRAAVADLSVLLDLCDRSELAATQVRKLLNGGARLVTSEVENGAAIVAGDGVYALKVGKDFRGLVSAARAHNRELNNPKQFAAD